MRDMFRGYYQPTEDEVGAIWRDGMIALDANILLSLYNVLPTTSALYLGAMEERKRQMWIPYQVAGEFHRNVHKERSKQTALHAARISRIKSLLDDFRSTAKKSRLQPSPLQEQAENALQALKDELDAERKQIAKQTHHHTRDSLLDRIAGVFETGVGPKPTANDLDEMFKEGAKRFEQKIPPGYEDEKDKKDNRKYGDYLLWRQLLNHAVDQKCDMIFVTDDNKADWWLKAEDGKTSLAPRPELIQEFREVTGQEILILNSEQFYYALVPAADDNSAKSKEVLAAQEDMKAAVSEAEETTSLYERLRDSLGNMDYQQLEAFASSPRSGIVKKYLEDRYGIRTAEKFDDDAARLAARRTERANLGAQIEFLTHRRNDLEHRLQVGAFSSTELLLLQRQLEETNDRMESAIRRALDLDLDPDLEE